MARAGTTWLRLCRAPSPTRTGYDLCPQVYCQFAHGAHNANALARAVITTISHFAGRNVVHVDDEISGVLVVASRARRPAAPAPPRRRGRRGCRSGRLFPLPTRAASVAGRARSHTTVPAARIARRLASLSTAPPPTLTTSGSSACPTSAIACASAARNAASPSWSKISATLAPARFSTMPSVSTTGQPSRRPTGWPPSTCRRPSSRRAGRTSGPPAVPPDPVEWTGTGSTAHWLSRPQARTAVTALRHSAARAP